MLGGGFKYFFIFTPIWGRFPVWLIFFKWVVQPPTSKKDMSFSGCWFVFMEVELRGSFMTSLFVCTNSTEWSIEISWFSWLTAEHISYKGGGNLEFLLWFKLWNIYIPEHASFETYICHGLLCILFMHAHFINHNFCTLHKSAIGIRGLFHQKNYGLCPGGVTFAGSASGAWVTARVGATNQCLVKKDLGWIWVANSCEVFSFFIFSGGRCFKMGMMKDS